MNLYRCQLCGMAEMETMAHFLSVCGGPVTGRANLSVDAWQTNYLGAALFSNQSSFLAYGNCFSLLLIFPINRVKILPLPLSQSVWKELHQADPRFLNIDSRIPPPGVERPKRGDPRFALSINGCLRAKWLTGTNEFAEKQRVV